MPELPEVETVRRGLAPVMEGAILTRVNQNRSDLRFPFPENFMTRLQGQRIEALRRRAKYLIADLSSGESLIMHLGMSGRFTILEQGTPGTFVQKVAADRHVHVVFEANGPGGLTTIHYADPRRFGFMDLHPTETLEDSPHFAKMGPEPLSNQFNGPALKDRLAGKRTPIKSALLDQRIVAGLGNIYVCEALFRAGISPRRLAKSIGEVRSGRLVTHIKDVLAEAIEAGGSSLRDYVAADGEMGYFQHRFDVYGREGEACRVCKRPITRLAQAGRSSFMCTQCQR